jgi:hypothetical protein
MKYIFLVFSLFIIIISNAQGKISGNIIHENKYKITFSIDGLFLLEKK